MAIAPTAAIARCIKLVSFVMWKPLLSVSGDHSLDNQYIAQGVPVMENGRIPPFLFRKLTETIFLMLNIGKFHQLLESPACQI